MAQTRSVYKWGLDKDSLPQNKLNIEYKNANGHTTNYKLTNCPCFY